MRIPASRLAAVSALAVLLTSPSLAQSDAATRLAKSMDVAFRACATHATSRDYIRPENIAKLADLGLTIRESAPQEVEQVARNGFPGLPVFAEISSLEAKIWLAAFQGPRLCRVMISDTNDGLGARLKFEEAFKASKLWVRDEAASQIAGGLWIQSYFMPLSDPSIPLKLSLHVSGPNTRFKDGRGLQTLMTVAVTSKETK